MTPLTINQNPEAQFKFENYPDSVKEKLNRLRDWIFEVAAESDTVSSLEETLKWGEPSYLVKGGSTIRMDWKPKSPDQYAIYFKCTSKLVPAFRKTFGDVFKFEKNRAIIFKLNDVVPENELKQCIYAALHYHSLKKIDDLGLSKI